MSGILQLILAPSSNGPKASRLRMRALPACKQSEDNSATPGSSIEPLPVPVPTTPVKSHVTDPDPILSPIEVLSAEQAVSPISQAIIPLSSWTKRTIQPRSLDHGWITTFILNQEIVLSTQ